MKLRRFSSSRAMVKDLAHKGVKPRRVLRPILWYASSVELEEDDEQVTVWPIFVSHSNSTLRVSAGTETLVEYVYVSKRACNCHV